MNTYHLSAICLFAKSTSGILVSKDYSTRLTSVWLFICDLHLLNGMLPVKWLIWGCVSLVITTHHYWTTEHDDGHFMWGLIHLFVFFRLFRLWVTGSQFWWCRSQLSAGQYQGHQNPHRHGERMQKEPGAATCEATMLTTAPPCCPV